MEREHKTWRERAGLAVGMAASPAIGMGSWLRAARLFHPSGLVLEGRAEAAAREGPLRVLAERLTGPVIARFSGGWWKHKEWPDVVGCALRFAHDVNHLAPTDQDLLLASFRSAVLLPLAPFTTRTHDFLANTYYGVSPFSAGPLRHTRFCLTPTPGIGAPADARLARTNRSQRLEAEVARGPIELTLSAVPSSGAYHPLLHITLSGLWCGDGANLRFDPFRDGRGVRPRGFLHATRFAAYAISQRMRPTSGAPEASPQPVVPEPSPQHSHPRHAPR